MDFMNGINGSDELIRQSEGGAAISVRVIWAVSGGSRLGFFGRAGRRDRVGPA
ncbi:hypothetical protein [Paracoccus sp. S1E-3]|uniref:hypothetical protein n=1 Tax=Paracoccus sp. S1E-3 TaxID=2756130 RepID=UPI0015EF4974|nr:hypothetical protein [Paracoccus sp. S1E-3]MBA4492277.1 hypothetical protein [Paracoccus sp. S1E-3]